MAGFEKQLKEPVRPLVSEWLPSTILMIATVAGVYSFASTFDAAHELQHDVLLWTGEEVKSAQTDFRIHWLKHEMSKTLIRNIREAGW